MYSELSAGAISETSTTPVYKLGEIRATTDRTYGTRLWRYVRVRDAATIGLGFMQEAGTDLYEVGLSGVATSNARMVGVAQHAIADDSYGWILKAGRGELAASATAIVADQSQKAVANGLFEVGTIGTDEIVGHSLELAASGATALAVINCGG